MERAQENNLVHLLEKAWHGTFRKLVYPGFRLSYGGICDCLLFSLFVLPTYFGIRFFFFDLTAFRFFEILVLYLIFKKETRKREFMRLIRLCPHSIFIAAFFFIVVYTNVYHRSFSAIFYWLMNGIFTFYLVAYLIIYEYGIEEFLKKVRLFTWFLVLVSPLELVIGRTPFSILDTLGKSSYNERFGNLRIMGNCSTTNGYAMYLCILLPFICYDYKRKRMDVLKNGWLLLFLMVNVLLTGSRLSVGIGILEIVLCILAQDRKTLRKTLLTGLVALPIIVVAAFLFRNHPLVNSMLLAFFSAVDEVFETSISVKFGADASILYNSSHYRDLLVEGTFGGGWLNPFMGRGTNYVFQMYVDGYYIRSTDNFYVGQFIAYAYPGLVTWLLMSASFLISAVAKFYKRREFIFWAAIVSIVGYFISLWYLDHLQTFPIMFAVFGVVYACAVLGKQKDKERL